MPETAFDDHGNPTISVGFQYPDDPETDHRQDDVRRLRTETMLATLAFLDCGGNASVQDIGRRAMLLNHLVNPVGTQRELAERIGTTPARASQLLKPLRRQMADLTRVH